VTPSLQHFYKSCSYFPVWNSICHRKHNAERHARGFTCWGSSWPALLPAGTPSRCGRLRAWRLRKGNCVIWGYQSARASHAGLRQRASPLADVRNGVSSTAAECQTLAASRTDRNKSFRFKNKLMSLDATVIDLCASCSTGPNPIGRKEP